MAAPLHLRQCTLSVVRLTSQSVCAFEYEYKSSVFPELTFSWNQVWIDLGRTILKLYYPLHGIHTCFIACIYIPSEAEMSDVLSLWFPELCGWYELVTKYLLRRTFRAEEPHSFRVPTQNRSLSRMNSRVGGKVGSFSLHRSFRYCKRRCCTYAVCLISPPLISHELIRRFWLDTAPNVSARDVTREALETTED